MCGLWCRRLDIAQRRGTVTAIGANGFIQVEAAVVDRMRAM